MIKNKKLCSYFRAKKNDFTTTHFQYSCISILFIKPWRKTPSPPYKEYTACCLFFIHSHGLARTSSPIHTAEKNLMCIKGWQLYLGEIGLWSLWEDRFITYILLILRNNALTDLPIPDNLVNKLFFLTHGENICGVLCKAQNALCMLWGILRATESNTPPLWETLPVKLQLFVWGALKYIRSWHLPPYKHIYCLLLHEASDGLPPKAVITSPSV